MWENRAKSSSKYGGKRVDLQNTGKSGEEREN